MNSAKDTIKGSAAETRPSAPPQCERWRELVAAGFDSEMIEFILEGERIAIHPLPPNVVRFHPYRA